jgi:hypothetical protein
MIQMLSEVLLIPALKAGEAQGKMEIRRMRMLRQKTQRLSTAMVILMPQYRLVTLGLVLLVLVSWSCMTTLPNEEGRSVNILDQQAIEAGSEQLERALEEWESRIAGPEDLMSLWEAMQKIKTTLNQTHPRSRLSMALATGKRGIGDLSLEEFLKLESPLRTLLFLSVDERLQRRLAMEGAELYQSGKFPYYFYFLSSQLDPFIMETGDEGAEIDAEALEALQELANNLTRYLPFSRGRTPRNYSLEIYTLLRRLVPIDQLEEDLMGWNFRGFLGNWHPSDIPVLLLQLYWFREKALTEQVQDQLSMTLRRILLAVGQSVKTKDLSLDQVSAHILVAQVARHLGLEALKVQALGKVSGWLSEVEDLDTHITLGALFATEAWQLGETNLAQDWLVLLKEYLKPASSRPKPETVFHLAQALAVLQTPERSLTPLEALGENDQIFLDFLLRRGGRYNPWQITDLSVELIGLGRLSLAQEVFGLLGPNNQKHKEFRGPFLYALLQAEALDRVEEEYWQNVAESLPETSALKRTLEGLMPQD